ncbi:hypothetical protein ACTFIY_010399 [Dictyostelium cf. discoideum]
MTKLISLKDNFYIPKSWFCEPCDDKFVYDIFKENCEMGYYNKNDEKAFLYCWGSIQSATIFWPKCNYEKSMMAGRFLQWLYFVDDFLDSLYIEDEIAYKSAERIISILITGKINSNPNKAEEYTLFYRNKMSEYCKTHTDYYDLIINTSIEFVRVSKYRIQKYGNGLPHYELYKFIRYQNSGVPPCIVIHLLINIDKPVNVKLWSNPTFKRMVYAAVIEVALVNDAVSYPKECINGNGYFNPFYFLQNYNNQSFESVFNFIVNESNQYIKQIEIDEIELIKQYENDPIEKENIKIQIDALHNLISGNFIWSCYSLRYRTKYSPFAETCLEQDERLDTYDKALPKIFKNLFLKKKE